MALVILMEPSRLLTHGAASELGMEAAQSRISSASWKPESPKHPVSANLELVGRLPSTGAWLSSPQLKLENCTAPLQSQFELVVGSLPDHPFLMLWFNVGQSQRVLVNNEPSSSPGNQWPIHCDPLVSAVDRLRMAAELPDPETNETIPLPEDVSDTLIRISKVAQKQMVA